MAIVIPRDREYWLKGLSNRVYEVDWSSPFADSLVAAIVAGNEIAAGVDWTANTTSQDGADVVATDNTVNAYIQDSLLTTSDGLGTGDFSLYIHANISASDGTISNLIGNKNDIAGSPYSQGFIGAHMNSSGIYVANAISLFTYSGGASGVQISSSVDAAKYQDVFASRIGSTLSLHVDDSSASASPTLRNITGADPRFIFGHSGKATHSDAGEFSSPIGLAWDRSLSEDEYNDLRQNPARILKPRRTYWVVPEVVGGGTTVSVPAGSLSITGLAPTASVTENQNIIVPVGSVSYSSFAPTVTASDHQAIEVPAGSVSISAYAPTATATDYQTVEVPVGAIAYTGFSPTVTASSNQSVDVPVGAITYAGFSPTITVGDAVEIAVPVGSISYSGFSPVVTATDHKLIPVPSGTVTITGYSVSVTASDHKSIDIPSGSIAVTGFSPLITIGDAVAVEVPVGSVAYTAFAPDVIIGTTINLLDFKRGSMRGSMRGMRI